MIAPRRSEGLFDLADLFNTSISLAGKPGAQVAEFVPRTSYIDGVDQTALLLADNGESARRSRPYTLNQYFAMMRVDEFKYIFTAEVQGGFFPKGDVGGFSGPIATETGGAVMVNLYTNPQEDVSVGVRHIPAAVPVMGAAGLYMKDLIKYPPQFKIGFLSNNPPVYDLLPKAKEAVEKYNVGKRPTPQD
jgi:arylsulfatase